MANGSVDRPDGSGTAKCLLCVDDHAEVLAIMGEFLRVSGYSVITAPSGQRGLQLLERNAVDAVILDYEMPRMDGAELAQRVKQTWPDLPVLMFTGYPSDVPESVRRSVDAFVIKGERADKLLQKLEELLPSSATRPSKRPAEKATASTARPRRRAGTYAPRHRRRA